MNEKKTIEICMIADSNYVIPTAVAIQSMKDSMSEDVRYNITVISSALDEEAEENICSLENDNVNIDIVRCDGEERFAGMHNSDGSIMCVASISALLKFIIPELLPNCSKVLYLDGDIIVKESLEAIYDIDISTYYAAVVAESGCVYYKHEIAKQVDRYFNSGVMLLNLDMMRENNISEKLIEEKKNSTDYFMDQNVFNKIFNKKVLYLPLIHNFLAMNLYNANEKWKIEDINNLFGTSFLSKKALFASAKIIHYSSKNKPWKDPNGVLAYEWLIEKNKVPFLNQEKRKNEEKPLVSIVMPCFNVEDFLVQTVNSLLNQTYENFEIICLDDGSTDATHEWLKILAKKTSKIRFYTDTNHGQGYQRNRGIKFAKGKYIFFMDSDDVLERDCLERLVSVAEASESDVVYFEGYSFFENSSMEKDFSHYKTCYNRREAYPCVYNGEELYVKFRNNGDYIVSPCLILSRLDFVKEKKITFPAIPMVEDNLFSYFLLTRAERVTCLPDIFYNRRVHGNSTMTLEKDTERIKAECLSWEQIIRETRKDFMRLSADNARYTVTYNHLKGFYLSLNNAYEKLSESEKTEYCNSADESVLSMLTLARVIKKNEDSILWLNQKVRRLSNPNAEIERLKKVNSSLKNENLRFKAEIDERDARNKLAIDRGFSSLEEMYLFELLETRKSFSYKVGRFFTFIPRLLRHVVLRKDM